MSETTHECEYLADGEVISIEKFVELFVDAHNRGDKFCFFLGAGASVESGIPSAYKLVQRWDSELSDQFSDISKRWSEWKKQYGVNQNNMANFYSEYYSWRFTDDEAAGHLFLQSVLQNSVSNRGYGMLANILINTRSNIVITTNFDQLVQREVYRLNKDCVAITHESIISKKLSTDIKHSNVPVIVKLHRDLYLNPMSRPVELKELSNVWKDLLTDIFSEYNVIFLGYAGNDPNVFSFLVDKATAFSSGEFKRPYWFIYDTSENHALLDAEMSKLSPFLRESHACVIQHKGFSWSIGKLFQGLYHIDELDWRSTSSEMLADLHRLAPIHKRKLLEKCLSVYKNDFLVLSAYASFEESEMNYEEAEKYYQLAMEANPFSVEIIGNYAVFLENHVKNYDKADRIYRTALNLTNEDAILLGNYAEFLDTKMDDSQMAEMYYKKALACKTNPNIEYIAYNYGEFIVRVHKNYQKAVDFFEETLKANPRMYNIIGAYAMVCHMCIEDFEKAETLYKRYIAWDKTSPSILCYYALFLDVVKNDEAESAKYYELAIKVDRECALAYGNYAISLHTRGYNTTAEEYYQMAIELEPYVAKGDIPDRGFHKLCL